MLYDAFYRWCRDATGETHNWPTNKAKAVMDATMNKTTEAGDR